MKQQRFQLLGIGVVIVLASMLVAAPGTDVKSLLAEVETLRDADNYTAALAKMKEAEKLAPENPKVLWKLARAYFDVADQDEKNIELQKANIYPGFEYAKKCIEIAPNVAEGHQYYSILIGRIGEIEGTKQKIENSYAVREHTLKAIELDPDNDSNYHVMGRWHFALADLSWVERKIASVIYATPPAASFEKAVEFFSKAHKLKPDDIRHLLWLGKSYAKLDQDNKARDALKKALVLPAESDADKNMQQEAQELLKKL
ncbi:MAG TPA: hypothetical protein ENN20_03485 [Candidatus Marinimicrobia bacterium]|nr:hypothetical protein [Candidatus Neomarinimicrobiota bacterium]